MVCLLSLYLCHNFSTPRNQLLLWLWHLKSFPYIVGGCSFIDGFLGYLVIFFLKCLFGRNLRDWNIALSYQNYSATSFTNTLKHWATDGIQWKTYWANFLCMMLPREIKLSVSWRTSPQREIVAKAMGNRKDWQACPSRTSSHPPNYFFK